ncbi:MAG: molybdopterin-dependent oxidoreductase [Chloroflexi bacterium]|nr:molybdopterin-dependent oxidoreductase [Chloroflexota bacterium]
MDSVRPMAGLAPTQPMVAGEDVWIPSVCRICANGCGLRVHRVDGVVVRIEGNPDNPHNFGKLCAKGQAAIMALYDPNRLRSCLRRTNPRKGPDQDPGWQEISWEEAVQEVVGRLGKIAADDPRKLLFANGTGDVDLPRMVGSVFAEAFGTPNYTVGVFFATHTRAHYLNTGSMHTEPDLDYCRLLMLFGSQKGTVGGHDTMKTAQAMARARARGMRLVAFDPMCSTIASKADEWVPLIPGTDGAVVLAMLHVLLNELGTIDAPFLARQTNAPYLVGPDGRYARQPDSGKPLVWDRADGQPRAYDDPTVGEPALDGAFQVGGQSCRPALELLRRHVAQFPPERAEAISTVPASTLRRLAREFGQTAQVGASAPVDGVLLPLRPVCAFADSRGSTCHSQGLWTGTAIQLLNVVVGAVDVPGGSISTSVFGPKERPRVAEGPDGMVMFGGRLPSGEQQYPGRTPGLPRTLQLHELFPLGQNPRPMLGLAPLDFPHLLPYRPELLIVWATNPMMTGVDPRRLAQALEQIPFVVGLGHKMDETLECADLVFPIAHHLERLDFPINRLEGWVTGRHWYWAARQPVVDPPPGVRHVVDVFLEWAERIGVLPGVNERLNARLGLADDLRLEPERRYSNAEITERRMQAMFGPDHDLGWFQQHGLVAWERTLAERYPRALVALPRVPVYYPHVLDRRQELQPVLDQLGLDWDLSIYQPLPVWLGCWSHKARQPDQFYAVNYKLAFHTCSTTQNNPWLMELAEHHRLALRVLVNTRTAQQRGIADGDEIELVGANGYTARGRARVSECIHPEVVGIASCFGHWSRGQPIARGKGLHFNSFIPLSIEGMELLSADYDLCALVAVRKV